MSKIWTFIANDNHSTAIAAVLILLLSFWIYGCQSTVGSIMSPDKQLSRDELQAELDYLLSQAKAKFATLDRQDLIKKTILEQATLFGSTGTFNPTGLLNLAVSVAAIGYGLDKRRKIKTIEAEKKPESA